jgi:hypothetical protein
VLGYILQGGRMTLAVFLLPHILDEPEVGNYLRGNLASSVDELMTRIRNGEDHKSLFSPAELSELESILHGTIGILRVLSVSWDIPMKSEMSVFYYKEKYFSVCESDVVGPSTGFDVFSLPGEASEFGFSGEVEQAECTDLMRRLLMGRNGERLRLNGKRIIHLDGLLLPIPEIPCCAECSTEQECRHVLGIIDDASSAVLGGYIADKLNGVAKILGDSFSSRPREENPVWNIRDERNVRLFNKLLDVYRKNNGGGTMGVLRNESFFRLIRNLLEAVCKTIKHPEDPVLKNFEVQPVCFISENVVDDLERLKTSLLMELGHDGDPNGPNDFGTIA